MLTWERRIKPAHSDDTVGLTRWSWLQTWFNVSTGNPCSVGGRRPSLSDTNPDLFVFTFAVYCGGYSDNSLGCEGSSLSRHSETPKSPNVRRHSLCNFLRKLAHGWLNSEATCVWLSQVWVTCVCSVWTPGVLAVNASMLRLVWPAAVLLVVPRDETRGNETAFLVVLPRWRSLVWAHNELKSDADDTLPTDPFIPLYKSTLVLSCFLSSFNLYLRRGGCS